MTAHRHSWERVGGPPNEPWDSNVYLACSCGKTKPYPCGDVRSSALVGGAMACAKPIGHAGRHRANGYEWGAEQ